MEYVNHVVITVYGIMDNASVTQISLISEVYAVHVMQEQNIMVQIVYANLDTMVTVIYAHLAINHVVNVQVH